MEKLTCATDGCVRDVVSRGFCKRHYTSERQNGRLPLLYTPRLAVSFEERFWAKVDRSGDGCWEWQGSRSGNGYGAVSITRPGGVRDHTFAHRLAWEFTYGPITGGLYICHRCDNRPCARPDHLFLGTYQENMADMVSKGRSTRGNRNFNNKLTPDQAREILHRAMNGETSKVLSLEFGVSRSTVGDIRHRRSWRWLDQLELVQANVIAPSAIRPDDASAEVRAQHHPEEIPLTGY